MDRIFGTDGVRGVANAELTPELAFRVGRAGAALMTAGIAPHAPIVIGRDTRLSGTMLEAAIVAGITSVGRDTLSVGIIPTPGVARITALIDAAAGVMISASHNPIEDNGIKLFGADGYKLTDTMERAIEAHLGDDALPRPTHELVGIATSAHGLIDRYFSTLLAAGSPLDGLTIVVDAAFGAAFDIGPRVFERLGARMVPLHARSDGALINVACGATDLTAVKAEVGRRIAADARAHVVGVAFDGDADRALFVDETGQALSGDHVMLILAREHFRRGSLAGSTVVGTVMSNLGLERALRADGIALARTPVGDRYVLEHMRANGFTFGGEQSGHVIDLTRNTTGDGLLTAITLLSIVARERTTLRELAADLHVYPQLLLNVRTTRKEIAQSDRAVIAAIAQAEQELRPAGRILVRPSGTEPLIRVMVEGDDQANIDRIARTVAQAIELAASR